MNTSLVRIKLSSATSLAYWFKQLMDQDTGLVNQNKLKSFLRAEENFAR